MRDLDRRHPVHTESPLHPSTLRQVPLAGPIGDVSKLIKYAAGRPALIASYKQVTTMSSYVLTVSVTFILVKSNVCASK